MIKKKVFLGKREDYNKKLKYLADLAQEEPWTFKSIAKQDPYRILRSIPMTDWTKRKRSCHRQMGSILASIRGF